MDSQSLTSHSQALILAGGRGTRLGDKTAFVPKPMMDVAGRPFIDYLIRNLIRHGIRDIVLSTGYLSNAISDYIGTGVQYGARIRHVTEDIPLGTGGAVKNCESILNDQFFVLNGDTLFDINFAALDSLSTNAVALRHIGDASRYGAVEVDGNLVTKFNEKGKSGPGLISGGILRLNKEALDLLPDGPSSLESDLLPTLVSKEQLAGLPAAGYFIDIGLPETLELAQEEIPDWERKPIAFLDRDGVLNEDHGYVHRIEDFDWIKDAKEAVRRLNETGYHVVVVTNQAGIARGYYAEEDFAHLTAWMQSELWTVGAHIDKVNYCPFHPDGVVGKYSKASNDRKPNPGMLEKTFRSLPHKKPGSFMIGDADKDEEAAQKAGVAFHRYSSGSLLSLVEKILDQTC